MFKIGDVVSSKRTGHIYTVTKIIGDYWFMHDKATKQHLMSNFFVIDFGMFKREYITGTPCVHSDGHKWIDVGFHFTKEICTHCDKERGK